MRCWKRPVELAIVFVVLGFATGCGALREQAPGHLAVRDARIAAMVDGNVLVLGLDCRLSGPMRDALDHGIPITLRVTIRGEGQAEARDIDAHGVRSVELRYFPLSRRYQLRELDGGGIRSFTAPAALIDALAGLRLDLPDDFGALPRDSRYRVDVAVDRSALPGALRLPAAIEPAWWLSAPTYRWNG